MRILGTYARGEAEAIPLSGGAATADHFGRILRAAELLGADCFVSGIRATVAQTMAELGMNIGSTRIFGTMQSALQVAILRSRRG